MNPHSLFLGAITLFILCLLPQENSKAAALYGASMTLMWMGFASL